jgi:hypothetical protein
MNLCYWNYQLSEAFNKKIRKNELKILHQTSPQKEAHRSTLMPFKTEWILPMTNATSPYALLHQ